MNQEPTILADLLNIFDEEELIRLAYRLRRVGKLESSLALDHELALRKAESDCARLSVPSEAAKSFIGGLL